MSTKAPITPVTCPDRPGAARRCRKESGPAVLEPHLEFDVAHLDAVRGRLLHGQFPGRQFDAMGKHLEMAGRRFIERRQGQVSAWRHV
jgi:hypothetical protein